MNEIVGFRFGTEWTAIEIQRETETAMCFTYVSNEQRSKELWLPKKAIKDRLENNVKTIIVESWFMKDEKNWQTLYFTMTNFQNSLK